MEIIRKVLIAEDSPTQALQLQMILEDKGYEVLHGLNGKEALYLIDENNLPDIIISDIIMPVMDGYEFCDIIKKNEKTKVIPVILLTQLSNANDVIKGLQCGADNFISKPYSEEFLFDRIRDITLNREIRRRSPNLDISMEIFFGGQKYRLNSNRMQILDLLLSTYYNAINKNKELEDKNLELKKLHKEAKIRNIQLNKLNNEKNQFLGIAAHDLRSPLATLSGYLSLVTDSLPEDSMDDQAQIFSTMNQMLDYMLNLITDVLDYSKIEAGTIELVKEEFNLVDFMNNTIELSNILGSQKNINIYSGYIEDEILITADKNKLKQVMDNLLSNALKYSERDTNVYINIMDLEDEIQIIVSDQGKGIPEKEVGKIFQPFATTSVKSTAGEKSTGLGLASVKKIVETHGGKIWVESKVGEGSKFYFTIPCEANKDWLPETTESVTNKPIIQVRELKVLIVENDEVSNTYLSKVLKGLYKEILHAVNGIEAIEICRKNSDIDLILMDINMPLMNGYEATQKIREFDENVIIIAQTTRAMEEDRQKAIEAGCNEYITKPIIKDDLLDMIKKLLWQK